jgi:hypothetical protein
LALTTSKRKGPPAIGALSFSSSYFLQFDWLKYLKISTWKRRIRMTHQPSRPIQEQSLQQQNEALMALICRSKIAKRRHRGNETRALIVASGLVLFYFAVVRNIYAPGENTMPGIVV